MVVFDFKYEQAWTKIAHYTMWESTKVKVFGLTINSNLTFDSHVCYIMLEGLQKVTCTLMFIKDFVLWKAKDTF